MNKLLSLIFLCAGILMLILTAFFAYLPQHFAIFCPLGVTLMFAGFVCLGIGDIDSK